MSVDSSTTSKVIKLYLRPHQENEDINYMRHTLKDWDIGKFKAPVYFYQPTVKPTPEGGIVKDTYSGSRKNKEFFEVRKEYIKRPEAENWMMYTSDGTLFKGNVDTLSSTIAIIYPGSDQFIIQTVNNSIRIKDGKDLDSNLDIDTVEKRRKQEADAKTRDLKNNLGFIYKHMEQKEKERQNQAKELREAGDEDIALGGSDDDDKEKDEDAFNNDENGADVEDARSDDDEDVPDDIENLLTDIPEELNEINASSDEEESQSSYDEDSEGEDGPKKKKKKKKGHNQPAEQQEAAHGENQDQAKPQSTEKIVDDILGPKVLKEDELVRYIMDVGYATLKQIYQKFKDRLVTQEQKMAFKNLILKRFQQFTDNGVRYVKLKDKK